MHFCEGAFGARGAFEQKPYKALVKWKKPSAGRLDPTLESSGFNVGNAYKTLQNWRNPGAPAVGSECAGPKGSI